MPSPVKNWLSLAIRMALFSVALLWPAGTLYWWEAWVMIGLWSLFGVVMTSYLSHHDPELLAERLKPLPIHREQKLWDKVIMTMFVIAGLGLYVIPGFDVVRHGWSVPFPIWIRISAMLIHIPCFVLLWWVMRENTYLSQTIKIDSERSHHVITTGPYALVRHPMYTVLIILLFAFPMALGSKLAVYISMFMSLLLIVRMHFEDRTLHTELEGYPDYAEQTPYRLIPGVW